MREDQVDRRLAERTMRRHSAVVPEHTIQNGDARRQYEHDQDEIGADETGNDPQAGHDTADCRQVARTAIGEVKGYRCRRRGDGK